VAGSCNFEFLRSRSRLPVIQKSARRFLRMTAELSSGFS
jgi:hypothetical protein